MVGCAALHPPYERAVASPPNFARDFGDEAELGFLFLDAERVAVDGRGEAALRAEAQLLERDVFGRLVDPALQRVLGFERRALGRDEAEHDLLVAPRDE